VLPLSIYNILPLGQPVTASVSFVFASLLSFPLSLFQQRVLDIVATAAADVKSCPELTVKQRWTFRTPPTLQHVLRTSHTQIYTRRLMLFCRRSKQPKRMQRISNSSSVYDPRHLSEIGESRRRSRNQSEIRDKS
jgi:hypothetical protein